MSKNKIAVITGASHPRDIGTAICRRLAADGVHIFFTHWHADHNWIGEFKDELLSMGIMCEEMTIDLSETQAAQTILQTVKEKLGVPSILINNAAHFTSGRIINMTSGQELGPMVGELAYAATKGAISAFTRTLAQELAPIGITVNAVNPGPTDSTWMNDEIRKYLLPKFPMGRIGSPEDVARVISFLASEEAQWMTGQIIHSEGGFLRG